MSIIEIYDFIPEEEFIALEKQSAFIESRRYRTTSGIWRYGTTKKSIVDAGHDGVAILTPSAVHTLQGIGIPVKVIYLYVNLPTMKKRLAARGDDKDEIERRVLSDAVDFAGAELLADYIVYNSGSYTVDEIVDMIYKKINEWRS